MNPSLFRKLLPDKAYHDASVLRCHLIDPVPCALIVFAVLFPNNAVSLLDRHGCFDYPEVAFAGSCCEQGRASQLSYERLLRHTFRPASKVGIYLTVPDRESPGTPPLFGNLCVVVLQLLLDL
jgi:hypothetical protein